MSVTRLFKSAARRHEPADRGLEMLLQGHSIEVMPKTASKIEDFRSVLAEGTRVYIAHIDGTAIDDMVATAGRIRDQGFSVMPHIPARQVANRGELEAWLRRYRDAGVDEALLIAGGNAEASGDFGNTMQMMETGLFDRLGFRRLHVAGHPEGNRDIDADGSTRLVDEALLWKQAFSERTDAEMAIVTQFVFDAAPVIAWAERIRAAGVRLPVHVGVAGPAKLQTLIRFAIACGVGPSLSVLQKRARDVTKLVKPYEPMQVLRDLAAHKAERPESPIAGVHFFPLGGILASSDWVAAHSRAGADGRAVS